MSYTYLELCNEVLRAFNEVELTASTASTAIGFHQYVRTTVNYAINDIYQFMDGEWPFAKTTATQVLTVPSGIPFVIEYSLPSDCQSVDWESFYIKRTADYNQKYLPFLDYDQYKRYNKDKDSNLSVDELSEPTRVARLQNNKWTVSPPPDNAYTIEYEYFAYPTELVSAGSAPLIPEQYRKLIVDRALYYCYVFRDNPTEAEMANDRYEKGVTAMRRALIPISPYMRFFP